MVRIENISFSYNKKSNVLNNFNLEAKQEEIIGVLGHNGAGKTTLFRIILGLITPHSGKVVINSQIDSISKNQRGYISYMPENGGIYDKLNAFENLQFRAELSKLDKNRIHTDSEKLLEELSLLDRASEKVGFWSNGMRKRLSFACSLISNRRVLLLDEPTNGLDPVSLNIITNIILERKKTGNITLINSHDLTTIQELCNRIIIIQDGEKIYDGKVDQISSSLKEFYLQITSKE